LLSCKHRRQFISYSKRGKILVFVMFLIYNLYRICQIYEICMKMIIFRIRTMKSMTMII